ncbi:imidazolonepropionase-like domain-containing protein [Bradyrhizobium sp. AZCC 2230]
MLQEGRITAVGTTEEILARYLGAAKA